MRAAAPEARSQVAASQMMIKDRKVFILFIHLFIIQFLAGGFLAGGGQSVGWFSRGRRFLTGGVSVSGF